MNADFMARWGFIAGIFVISGLILLIAWYKLISNRARKIAESWQRFLMVDLLCRLQTATFETVNECLDLLPEKMIQARRAAEKDLDSTQ